jgi:hypothetical protein
VLALSVRRGQALCLRAEEQERMIEHNQAYEWSSRLQALLRAMRGRLRRWLDHRFPNLNLLAELRLSSAMRVHTIRKSKDYRVSWKGFTESAASEISEGEEEEVLSASPLT